MIPIKDKKYLINFKSYWGSYAGEGIFTGEKEDFCGNDGDTIIYGFKIPADEETCFFLETDIVAEIVSNEKIKESMQEQIMNYEQFAIWLHGFLEISNAESIDKQQTQIIKDHLALLFEKKIPDKPVFPPNQLMSEGAVKMTTTPVNTSNTYC